MTDDEEWGLENDAAMDRMEAQLAVAETLSHGDILAIKDECRIMYRHMRKGFGADQGQLNRLLELHSRADALEEAIVSRDENGRGEVKESEVCEFGQPDADSRGHFGRGGCDRVAKIRTVDSAQALRAERVIRWFRNSSLSPRREVVVDGSKMGSADGLPRTCHGEPDSQLSCPGEDRG